MNSKKPHPLPTRWSWRKVCTIRPMGMARTARLALTEMASIFESPRWPKHFGLSVAGDAAFARHTINKPLLVLHARTVTRVGWDGVDARCGICHYTGRHLAPETNAPTRHDTPDDSLAVQNLPLRAMARMGPD